MTTSTKSARRVQIKDADAGTVEAVFATLDVIDLDGDVLRKGAFTDGAPVVISAYGHRSHIGELPIGKGALRLTDTEALVDCQFLMDTTHGRDAFLTVKAMGDLQEWSFSLHDIESHQEVINGQKANVITHVRVKEVSPVLLGAGVNTRTLAVKGLKEAASIVAERLGEAARERWEYAYLEDWDVDDSTAVFRLWDDGADRLVNDRLVKVSFTRTDGVVLLGDDEADVERTVIYEPKSGSRFVEHAKSVLTDLDELVARAAQVVTLRAGTGKNLSAETAGVLAQIAKRAADLPVGTAGTSGASPGLSPLHARIHLSQLEDSLT